MKELENRREPVILDCTVRDGGLVNNWDFSPDFVRDLYRSLDAAGVEYMEIGYKNSPKLLKSDGAGPWRFLDDAYIREIIPQKGRTKLSALVDIGRVDENDIRPREESPLDLIRVACYINDVAKAVELVNLFSSLGYETSLNIMALSRVLENELTEALEQIDRSRADIVYIVDSFGSFYPHNIGYLAGLFRRHAPGKTLGVHTHNNMQLALANTLEAVRHGVTFLDASVFGMGRAAGNCHTELLAPALRNKRYNLRPILEMIEKHMVRVRKEWEWGYTIPYALSGMFNEHPRMAMALRSSAEERDHYVAFYDRITSVETAPAKA